MNKVLLLPMPLLEKYKYIFLLVFGALFAFTEDTISSFHFIYFSGDITLDINYFNKNILYKTPYNSILNNHNYTLSNF